MRTFAYGCFPGMTEWQLGYKLHSGHLRGISLTRRKILPESNSKGGGLGKITICVIGVGPSAFPRLRAHFFTTFIGCLQVNEQQLYVAAQHMGSKRSAVSTISGRCCLPTPRWGNAATITSSCKHLSKHACSAELLEGEARCMKMNSETQAKYRW